MTESNPRSRTSDPTTSQEAGARVAAPEVERAWMAAWSLRTFTDGQLARRMSQQGRWTERGVAARRRLDLVRLGLVAPVMDGDTQERQVSSSSNRSELVWRCMIVPS